MAKFEALLWVFCLHRRLFSWPCGSFLTFYVLLVVWLDFGGVMKAYSFWKVNYSNKIGKYAVVKNLNTVIEQAIKSPSLICFVTTRSLWLNKFPVSQGEIYLVCSLLQDHERQAALRWYAWRLCWSCCRLIWIAMCVSLSMYGLLKSRGFFRKVLLLFAWPYL